MTYEPSDKDACIKAIQANRANHSCDYQTASLHEAVLGHSERFELHENAEGHPRKLDIKFEDNNDQDFDDFTFRLDLSEVPMVKMANRDECGAS